MSQNSSYGHLVTELDDLRRQWRMTKLLEGGLLVVAGVTGILILLIAADNLLKPGTGGRFLLAAILWGMLAVTVMTFVVRRWLEDRRDDFFAALVEQRHPELRNRLINALQLGRGAEYGSPRIIEAIVLDASRVTSDMDISDCVDWQPVKRGVLVTGVVLLLIVVYAIVFPPRFTNGLGRVLLPVANIHPYSATVIDAASIRPTDGKRFPEGDTVEISVAVGGDVIPDDATLFIGRHDGKFRPVPMGLVAASTKSDAKNRFQFTVTDAAVSFRFYIEAGDDRTEPRTVEVVPRPRVAAITVQTTPPAYTGRQPAAVDDTAGDVFGLVGTSVQLTLTATKPLQQASLETESGEVIELATGANDGEWRGEFVLWSPEAQNDGTVNGRKLHAPTRYRAKLIDSDGYENNSPLWRAITVVRDQPPRVTIVVPGRDSQVKPDESVKLTVSALDDHGLSSVRLLYRVNDEENIRELTAFPFEGAPEREALSEFEWNLSGSQIQAGDLVQYWAAVTDRNTLTGPGEAVSRRFSLFVVTPEQILARLEMQLDDYAAVLEELIRLQRENRAQTTSGVAFETLVTRQTKIRANTAVLSQAMKKDASPLTTVIAALHELHVGRMADAVRLFEAGRDTQIAAKSTAARNDSLPVQEEIISQLEELLKRLQRNEQARNELRRIRKKDEASHKALTDALSKLVSDLDRLVMDESELDSKLEKMPKRPVDELNDEELGALKQFEEFADKWSKWRAGTIDELTKLPTGFIDDFGLRADVNSVFEEIEQVAQRPKTTKLEVALEDAGSSKATEMLEDLETWMPDAPDALQWVMEEPLDQKPMEMPEMPLPDALEDLIGDLMQEEDDFDEEADDITSAWGDNLNQAGWGVSDGPISNFSAKGKTGNDLPNKNEVTGRAGDGRRGKSSGQMVGDTARGLEGRKTPARLNNERYEPGKLKEEGRLNPNGSTGGGKKAGDGKKGLQGGTPPDFVRDMERLAAKQAGMREKAQQIARQLDNSSVSGRKLQKSIQLMQSVETDLRDLRYEDAARKRRMAIRQLKSAFGGIETATAVQLNQARDLPVELREELLQSADEGYPKGYESLLQGYFRALSEAEK